MRQVSFTLLIKCHCNSNSAQYERNRRFGHLVYVSRWWANDAKLPSVGLWLNASKSESRLEAMIIWDCCAWSWYWYFYASARCFRETHIVECMPCLLFATVRRSKADYRRFWKARVSYTVEQFLHCDPLKLSPVVSGLSCPVKDFSWLIKRCWILVVLDFGWAAKFRFSKREKKSEKKIWKKINYLINYLFN